MRLWGLLFFCLLGPLGTAHAAVSNKLLSQLENYASQLDKLETELADNHEQLEGLSATLMAAEDTLAHRRQNLMNDVSQLHVTVRDVLRMARFPWQAQMLSDLNEPQTPRQGVLAQSQRWLALSLAEQQNALKDVLTEEYELRQLLAKKSAHTEALQKKQARIYALHQKHLKTLRVQDKKLAAKLAVALPVSRTVPFKTEETLRQTPLPHDLPVRGFVTHRYGEPDESGRRPDGTTILAMPGAAVQALRPGQVLFSSPFRDYGWLIIVGDGERQDVYSGLDFSSVAVGDQVAQGEALGGLPNTETPLLYYEARYHDRPVAPVF